MTLRARAEAITPRGSQTLSKRPSVYPIDGARFAHAGEGAYVTAIDGERYLDFVCSLGATTLGYGHPTIIDAVMRQVKDGGCFSFPHVREVEVAERLCAIIPCAENIRFLKTGSEACAAAVSTARAYTKRNIILCEDIGYHGWHEMFRVLAPSHPGVPDGLGAFVKMFRYGDLDHLASLLDDTVAAVFMEPARLSIPSEGYLAAVKAQTQAVGALLIFDEMILGGRHALAGGQEFFDVQPDLATFGKAFGAGYPLAFLAGSRDIMQHAWVISGTYSGDAIALAACDAMLTVYQRDETIKTIHLNGSILANALAMTTQVTIHGYPPHFQMRLTQHDQRIGMSYFVQQCAMKGVLFHPQIVNASGVMDARDVIRASAIASDILRDMAQMSHTDVVKDLRSAPYEDSVRR